MQRLPVTGKALFLTNIKAYSIEQANHKDVGHREALLFHWLWFLKNQGPGSGVGRVFLARLML